MTRGEKFGKLSPTNGLAISVDSKEYKGTTITACLLRIDGTAFFEGSLYVTKGEEMFINGPKTTLLEWIEACGRKKSDARGKANNRNTVYAFREDDVTNLHFVDLDDTEQARSGSCNSLPEKPKEVNPPQIRSRQTPMTRSDVHASCGLCSIEKLRKSNWEMAPDNPGVYWWYFPHQYLECLGIARHSDLKALNLRRAANEKLCLYVGIAANLRERIEWHAAQHLSQSALDSGWLSTLRFSLIALAEFDYNSGEAEINSLMDALDVRWISTRGKSEAEEIEATELGGNFHFPLNIKGNQRSETIRFVKHLKKQREAYRERYSS